MFHITHGMIVGFGVTDEESGAPEPTADVDVTVSSDGENGSLEIQGDFRPSKQTIAVHFADHAVHGTHDMPAGRRSRCRRRGRARRGAGARAHAPPDVVRPHGLVQIAARTQAARA